MCFCKSMEIINSPEKSSSFPVIRSVSPLHSSVFSYYRVIFYANCMINEGVIMSCIWGKEAHCKREGRRVDRGSLKTFYKEEIFLKKNKNENMRNCMLLMFAFCKRLPLASNDDKRQCERPKGMGIAMFSLPLLFNTKLKGTLCEFLIMHKCFFNIIVSFCTFLFSLLKVFLLTGKQNRISLRWEYQNGV